MEQENTRKRHIDYLASQIIKAKEIQEFEPKFLYSLDLFDQDFYDYPEIDWKTSIEKIIQHLIDLKDIYNLRISNRIEESKNFTPNPEILPSFLDFDDFELDPETKNSNKEFNNHTDSSIKIEFNHESSIRLLYDGKFDWIDKNIKTLEKCMEYFDKYSNEPPYNFPVNKVGKIPFFGGANDFAVLFNLLELYGNFFITERSNQANFIKNFKFPSAKEEKEKQKNIQTANSELKQWELKKNEFFQILAQTFYSVDVEKKSINYERKTKQFKENALTLNTITSKAAGESLPDLSEITIKNFINSFENIIERLKKMQGVKDPD